MDASSPNEPTSEPSNAPAISRMPPRSASWRAKLAGLAFGTFVALLLAEVALRIFNPIALPLRGKEIVLPVAKRFEMDNPAPLSKLDAHITRTANRLGFRGPEPPADPDTHVRIIAVGGSTTMCQFLSDGKTWPEQLAARLDGAVKKPVWVNNAGMDGHSTFGHLRLLEQHVLELRPDYILLLVGVNDVGRDDLNEFDAQADPANLSLRDRIVAKSELLSTVQVLYRSWRAYNAGVGHLWELDLKTNPKTDLAPAELAAKIERSVAEHRQKYLPAYEARLTRLVELARERRIEPVLLTQPVLYGDSVDPATGVALGPLLHGDVTAAERWRLLELYNEVTERVGRERGLLVIDLARKLPKDSRLYYDWMHYTNAGAERVAEIVAAELIPRLRAR